MVEKIIVVDEGDNVIGFKERGKLEGEDIYRVACLWLGNGDKVLLARRSLDKKKDPGLWGPAVAGTVEKGESYFSNIVKESREELGLKKVRPVKGIKTRVRSPHNHFTQWFVLDVSKEKDFNFNEEVAEVRWFLVSKLRGEIKKNPEKFVYSLVGAFDGLVNG